MLNNDASVMKHFKNTRMQIRHGLYTASSHGLCTSYEFEDNSQSLELRETGQCWWDIACETIVVEDPVHEKHER